MDMDRTEQRVSVAHVEVHLSGGAPWGFTLKGGLEHGEPLIITKIEAGGKAALCQRLRVGDELITINGTVLYGSRQEALILIKGSYRVLKLTVRRRSWPVPRPHSWHLDQISEPSLPPLLPSPLYIPFFTLSYSDLSIQWGALSRPYSSTDRSSSLGSMESLDTPTPTTQTNYDSHNSPVDPALFNNKRDSAYSSFSASSNMSDYATVPLRFGEGGSMENLLQNLGSNGDASQVLDNGQLIALKSRSLTRPRPKQFEMKERPSSCCYEDERKVNELAILQNGKSETKIKSNPPQPPTRKDSFRATKTRPIITNDRCSSAPIEIGNAPNFYDDCTTTKKSVQNGFLPLENDKDDCLESCYIQDKAPITCSKSSNTETTIFRPQNKHSTNVLHRHSAPEKLLAQLQLLQFDDAPIEAYMQPESTNVPSSSSSQRSQPENDKNSLQTLSSKWGGSRSSTPGSLFLEDCVEREEFQNEKLEVSCETSNQVAWGRSVSVPEEQVALSVCNNTLDNVNERDFQPLSSALSVDTLVERKTEIIEVESATLKKSSRNLRKNRRRNERFATNLRNEIQRKKAQLQSSRGPGGLLCSGETVHEEGPDFQEDGDFEPERKVAFATTTTATAATTTLEHPKTTMENCLLDSTKEVVQSNPSRAVQIVDSGVASFGIRVIEEPAPAGKARRWRWTPEHKLQPENDPQPRRNDEKLLAPSRHGVCAFTSSSISTYPRSMSCSRMEQSDILPFADRMKFFEETSKSGITKTASQPKQKSYNVQEQVGDLGPYQSQRRYSYQGGYRQESSNLMEARRQSVSAKEREERLRQMRGELEERETEERMRQWEREREMERRQELERIREMDRMKREKEEMEREREEYFASNCQEIHQNYHQRRDNLNNFQPDSCSAFYPVKGPSLQFDDQRHQGFTPTEMYSARQQETTKLNRKYSLTERDFSSRPWESRPVEQIRRTHRQDSHSAPAPAPLRTRAMSENDLRFEVPHQRWSPSLSIASTQTLTEVNEGFNQNLTEKTAKKKTPPPPRPPPPKWEQFHKRRASHHAIYSSSPQTIPPLSVSSNEIQPSQIQNRPTYKQPAYVPPGSQIPPLHLSSNHMQEPLFTIAPPSPMFSRRSFRPVAPPQWNNRGSVSEETEDFSDSETNVILNQEQITKTQPSITRHTAEWERSISPRIHSDTPPPPPPPVFQNGNPETSLSINLQQNHNLKSEFETINNINGVIEPKNIEIDSETTLSPAQSLDTDLDAPLETDIDDFQEEGLPVANEPISSELPCLALPVTVLETDLDTLPEHETSPSSTARPDSSLLEEELEVREEGSLEEIFPQSSEGESGTESWRGASQSTEHNTDSLDRRSGASSSCSSYYSTSTAKAQLLSQMKDFTEERENQDELMYKKQLMESLRKKLGVLREAQRGLQEDIRANAQLGEEVEAMVVSVCKPNEVDKFRMFIGDLDKVVSLMLSLSGRLLRVETTLDTLDSESDHEERLPLQEKKRQLMRQLSEAQDLKEHVDRREQAVSRVLGRCLSPEQHRDYSHFVKMKAALLVEQKQLEDKIRLGEEQLRGLRESLGLGVGAGFGLAMGYGQY
ncbi:hypothetical protein NQD34_013466 [Periophthalmus magnuspinnatus]|nr:hypothetical protein NQD34_013466 [Periophthalmus magnuspinnatus]